MWMLCARVPRLAGTQAAQNNFLRLQVPKRRTFLNCPELFHDGKDTKPTEQQNIHDRRKKGGGGGGWGVCGNYANDEVKAHDSALTGTFSIPKTLAGVALSDDATEEYKFPIKKLKNEIVFKGLRCDFF